MIFFVWLFINLKLSLHQKSKTDDCMETKWYEQDCFFQVRRPVSENLIDGFDNVRHIHKIEILKRLGNNCTNAYYVTLTLPSLVLGIGDTAKPQRM